MAEKKEVEAKGKGEEKAKEGAEEEEKRKVTILSRTFMTVYPRLREAHKLVHVAYMYEDYPPRVIEIDLFEHFKDKQDEVERQVLEGKGELAEKYFEIEREAIKKDLEEMLKQKPEVVEV